MKGDLKRALKDALEYGVGRGIIGDVQGHEIIEWVDDDSQIIEWLCLELGSRDGISGKDVLKRALDECGVSRDLSEGRPIRF